MNWLRRPLIAVLLLIGPVPRGYCANDWPKGPLKGVVNGGRVYGCGVVDRRAVLCWATLAGKTGPAVLPKTLLVSPPCCWHITPAYAWFNSVIGVHPGNGSILPRDEIDRYELPDLLKGKLRGGPGARDLPLGASFMPTSVLQDIRLNDRSMMYQTTLHYDFLPVSADSIRLFVLTDIHGDYNAETCEIDSPGEDKKEGKWSFRVFDYKAEWDKDKQEWKSGWDDDKKKWKPGVWSLLETIAVEFNDSFQVIAQGDDYYFITARGSVYRAAKPDKGKERKLVSVWEGVKGRVAAFIQDIDTGKTFAFCRADEDGKTYYFELAPKVERIPYNAKGIKPAKIDDPLPAILGYTKILLADKKIKEK
jgi:hypothetical protein